MLSGLSWKSIVMIIVILLVVAGIWYAYRNYGSGGPKRITEGMSGMPVADPSALRGGNAIARDIEEPSEEERLMNQIKLQDIAQVSAQSAVNVRNRDYEKIENTALYPYFEIAIGGKSQGRVYFELFDENAPRTCMNFRTLCMKSVTGKGEADYKNTVFHRVIKGFMIQGGDTTRGNGTGGMSIYGERFEDEPFEFTHNQPGLLSMANAGPNTNGSQFFITTKAPLKHLDGKHVVFGIVVKGYDIIERIEKLETDGEDRPLQAVQVIDCGLEEME